MKADHRCINDLQDNIVLVKRKYVLSSILYADNFVVACEGLRKACYVLPLPMEIPVHPIMLPFTAETYPTGVTYDPIEETLYLVDAFGDLFKFSFRDKSLKNLRRGLWGAMGIAIDHAGRNIFFSEQYLHRIVVRSIDHPYEATSINVPSPQGIAIDSFSG